MSVPWRATRKPGTSPATPSEQKLIGIYSSTRLDIMELEHLIADGEGLSEQDLKRLDKAVTVIKVGFKLVKLVLKKHGYQKTKPTVKEKV